MKTISLQSSHLEIPEGTLSAIKRASDILKSDKLDDILQDYPDPSGDEVLRERVNAVTPTWGGDVLITGSATQALNLVLGGLEKGKVLAAKTPVFFGVLRQAESLGLKIKTWNSVDDLKYLGEFDTVLLSSNFTPPEGISFSKEEKKEIALMAEKNNALIIEDNAYDPIWYDNFPEPINYNPEKIIRICSLSKIVAPAFRLGFIKASPSLIKKIRSAKITSDLSTSIIPQLLAREALESSVLESFRKEMQERLFLLHKLLRKETGLDIVLPQGGIFVCLKLPENTDVENLKEKLLKLGISVGANGHYYPDGKNRPYIRLNAGAASKEEIRHAAAVIGIIVSRLYDNSKKTVLITAGQAVENLDSVRHFKNIFRREGDGYKLANALCKQGMSVVVVSAKTKLERKDGISVIGKTVEGKIITTTHDIVSTAEAVAETINPDIIVSMASVPSIKPVNEVDKKLKVKTNLGEKMFINVQKNISPVQYLADNIKTLAVIGYNQFQEFEIVRGDSFASEIQKLVDRIEKTPQLEPTKESLPNIVNSGSKALNGRKIIVTSGHTEEKLNEFGDIITNFASGRQGHAVALALAKMGAEVVLITGNALVEAPSHKLIRTVCVKTAEELQQASLKELPVDAAVCVCAVGDFKAGSKGIVEGSLEMLQNPDTLMSLGLHLELRPKVVIGFAAETNDLIEYATLKLNKKGADAICANQVGNTSANKNHDMNSIYFITKSGITEWSELPKQSVGFKIGEFIAGILD